MVENGDRVINKLIRSSPVEKVEEVVLGEMVEGSDVDQLYVLDVLEDGGVRSILLEFHDRGHVMDLLDPLNPLSPMESPLLPADAGVVHVTAVPLLPIPLRLLPDLCVRDVLDVLNILAPLLPMHLPFLPRVPRGGHRRLLLLYRSIPNLIVLLDVGVVSILDHILRSPWETLRYL